MCESVISSVTFAATVLFSKEWAVSRLREKTKSDARYNYLLRQSGKEFRCYTLVYKNPLHKEPICLQIKQMPDTGLYQLVVDGNNPTAMASVQELVAHYRYNSSDDAIALQQCVIPANPCKPSSWYFHVAVLTTEYY